MNEHVKALHSLIQRGREGKNKGLSMGLPKLEGVVYGVQRGIYTLLAGGTGSGKTTLALYSYVYRPLVDNMASSKPRRIKILYYSLEMSAEILLAKLLSLHLFETYGVELSFKDIISKQEALSDEHYELIVQSQWWLDRICEDLIIYDKAISPDALYANLMEYSDKHGTWLETEHNQTYTPDHPDEIVEVIVDHMGLIRKGKLGSKKEAIDLASTYLIHFRNKCGYSPLALFQINRQSSSTDRRKAEHQEIQLDDIKETGNPAEDAEIVMAIFNPYREKLPSHRGYDLRVLKDKYRAVQVLKHRFGEADRQVSINFFGSVGYWRELPKADEIRGGEREYDRYLNLIPRSTQDVDYEEEPKTGLSYGFTM